MQNFCVIAETILKEVLSSIQQSEHGLCIVVDAQERILGTITDGDCRRALLRGATLESPAHEVMNRNFLAVDPSFSNEQIRLLMKTNDVRQIPIVDADRKLVRVVSERSLRSAGTVRPNAAMILAGGKGQRLGGLTRHRPKPMLPVASKPMLEHIITQLVDARITKIYISIGYLGHMIQEYFTDGSPWGCSIEYLPENEPLGTGGPLTHLEGKVTDPFIVTNGDVITTVNFGSIIDYHTSSSLAATVGVTSYQVQIPYGVVSVGAHGLISSMTEKPTQSFPVNAGIYVIEPRLIARIPKGVTYPITELISSLINEKERVGAFAIHETWDDIGVPKEFINAQTLLEEE